MRYCGSSMRRVSRGWRGMIRCGVIGGVKACLADFCRVCVFYNICLNDSTAFLKIDSMYDYYIIEDRVIAIFSAPAPPSAHRGLPAASSKTAILIPLARIPSSGDDCSISRLPFLSRHPISLATSHPHDIAIPAAHQSTSRSSLPRASRSKISILA